MIIFFIVNQVPTYRYSMIIIFSQTLLQLFGLISLVNNSEKYHFTHKYLCLINMCCDLKVVVVSVIVAPINTFTFFETD